MRKHEEWLYLASEDLRSAKKLLEDEDPLVVTSVYHSQQCAEKALKAYLSFKRRPVKKIHDLPLLNVYCTNIDPEFAILMNAALELNPYHTQTRYPEDGFAIPSLDLARFAIKCAQTIFDFVELKVPRIRKEYE